jgi:hypothetical protein
MAETYLYGVNWRWLGSSLSKLCVTIFGSCNYDIRNLMLKLRRVKHIHAEN